MNRLPSSSVSSDPLREVQGRSIHDPTSRELKLNPNDMQQNRRWQNCPFKHTPDETIRELLVNETSSILATLEDCPENCHYQHQCLKNDSLIAHKILCARRSLYELKIRERISYMADKLEQDNNLTTCNDEYKARLSNDSGKSQSRFGRHRWILFVHNGAGEKVQVCPDKFSSFHGISQTTLKKAQEMVRERIKDSVQLKTGLSDRKEEFKNVLKAAKGDSHAVMFMVKWMKEYAAAGFGEIQPHGDQLLEDNRAAQGSEVVYRLHIRHWECLYAFYVADCTITVDALDIKQFKDEFRDNPELKLIHRARKKCNFGICDTCVKFTARFLNTSRHDKDTRDALIGDWIDKHMCKVVSLRKVYNDNVYDASNSTSDSLMIEVDAWTKAASKVLLIPMCL